MGYFESLNALNVFRISKPFSGLRTVKSRAEQILADKSTEDIDGIAKHISYLIDSYIEEKIEEDLDRHAAHLSNHGGWELAYFEGYDEGFYPTYGEARELLSHWPHYVHDKPDMLAENDIEHLTALQDIIETDQFYSLGMVIDFSMAQAFAVLALLRLEIAASHLQHKTRHSHDGTKTLFPNNGPWDTESLIVSGNIIVEAMEIVCWAERQASDEQVEKWRGEERERNAQRQGDELIVRDAKKLKENGGKLAKARWGKDAEQRERVKKFIGEMLKDWDENPKKYSNQDDFSRAMEEKIETDGAGNPVYMSSTIKVKIIPELRKSK